MSKIRNPLCGTSPADTTASCIVALEHVNRLLAANKVGGEAKPVIRWLTELTADALKSQVAGGEL